MSTYSYYHQFRTLSRQKAALEGLLQFSETLDAAQTCAQIELLDREMRVIEERLNSYIPYQLPLRMHYRATVEREFLFYRCIKGLTMEKTAELLGVSRDTVYRIKRRLSGASGDSFTFPEDAC